MKFNKQYSKYAKLYLENVNNFPDQGDQVVFKKGWEKDEYAQSIVNTSTGERIRAMIDQGTDPLIITGIQYKRPTSYGSCGSQEQNHIHNETEIYATVSQQYALGLYNAIVVCPVSMLQRVENGTNLPPLSDNQVKEYRQTTGEHPNLNNSPNSPLPQTNAALKDHGFKNNSQLLPTKHKKF